MSTVKQLHAKWSASIMPSDAPQIQRQEMERAFYSGAFAFFALMTSDIATLPDADAEKAMQTVQNELQDYFRLMRASPGPQGTKHQ